MQCTVVLYSQACLQNWEVLQGQVQVTSLWKFIPKCSLLPVPDSWLVNNLFLSLHSGRQRKPDPVTTVTSHEQLDIDWSCTSEVELNLPRALMPWVRDTECNSLSLCPEHWHHTGCRGWKCLLKSNGKEAKEMNDGDLLLSKRWAPAMLCS